MAERVVREGVYRLSRLAPALIPPPLLSLFHFPAHLLFLLRYLSNSEQDRVITIAYPVDAL